MRQMEKEVSEKKMQKPAEELHEQSAQAARQPAVFDPFSDGEIVECRQITPAELRILSRRDRGLMNNNFLRHGYITAIIICSWAEEEMTAGTYSVFRAFMTGRNVMAECSVSPT